MLITQIEPPLNKKRKVYIDYEYAFPLYSSDIKKYRLEEGCEIDTITYDELCKMVISRISRRIAYYITDYDRSEYDIRKKMQAASYPDELIIQAIDKMKSYSYVDDYRYARTYVQSLINKNKSITYIRQKLYEKGIERGLADTVIEDLSPDENIQIEGILRKKGYNTERMNELDAVEQRKLFAYLVRQGFSMERVRSFFKEMY